MASQPDSTEITKRIQRYKNDEKKRPAEKFSLSVNCMLIFVVWLWSFEPNIAGLAYLAIIYLAVRIGRNIRYLLGKDPTDEIFRNITGQF